jgi:glucose/mannose-6-phosphate isomerase
MNLDDAEALGKVDKSHMLELMEKTPERLLAPPEATSGVRRMPRKPRCVVIGGVGGSGIVGDVLADYLRYVVEVPISVCRNLQLPSTVTKNALFIAITYSGETRETLALMAQAARRKARMIAITSGGAALSQCVKTRTPYVKVPAGMLPRVALPEMVAAVTSVFGSAGILKAPNRLLSEASKSLAMEISAIRPGVPMDRNPAKQMAQALRDKLPVLIGHDEDTSVLRRFKNELNENGKMPAFFYTVPEAYHDDIEGLRTLRQLVNVKPIILRNRAETPGQMKTREKLYSLLSEIGFPSIIEFEGIGNDRLSQLLTAIMFGDYVSVYLAALRAVDPSEVMLIPKFREAMRV